MYFYLEVFRTLSDIAEKDYFIKYNGYRQGITLLNKSLYR